MKTLRSVLIVLTLGLSVGLVAPTAATAAGERCTTTKLAKRCADIEGKSGTMFANAGISAIPSRARVLLVSVAIQYRMGDVWVDNNRNEPEPDWVSGGTSSSSASDCANAADGKWRSKGVMKWKLGRDGKVRKGTVVSRAFSRDRLCG